MGMFCISCGESVVSGARFCARCGTAVVAPTRDPQTPPTFLAPPPQGWVPVPPPPGSTGSGSTSPGSTTPGADPTVSSGPEPALEVSDSLRYLAGSLAMLAALCNFIGIFPSYMADMPSLSSSRGDLAFNLGYVALLAVSAIALMVLPGRGERAIAALWAVTVSCSLVVVLMSSDVAEIISGGSRAAAGFWWQFIGVVFALAAATVAGVAFGSSHVRMMRWYGSRRVLGFGALAVVLMIVSEGSNTTQLTYSTPGEFPFVTEVGNRFESFGWNNLGQVGLWVLFAAVIWLASRLWPRLAGTVGLAVLTVWLVWERVIVDFLGSGETYTIVRNMRVITVEARPTGAMWWGALAAAALAAATLETRRAPTAAPPPDPL
jgi:hypothetical protein